ncbi:Metallo-dependent hydrolase [Violaceomyces palustris]|uniref:Metallo-dependent hydrolase n=1 Tax=Violaceomyces palustris TaxID=1673888 RepID=A0ACD0NTT7_9BASI|nr:Metallo-dependent hydrolase [Violaceomyces palustris]
MTEEDSIGGYRLICSGSNSGGQLGLGTVEDVDRFSDCLFSLSDGGSGEGSPFPPEGEKVICLSSGSNHTACLTESSLLQDHHPRGGGDDVRNGERSKSLWICGQGWEFPGDRWSSGGGSWLKLFTPLDFHGEILNPLGLSQHGRLRYEPVLSECGWNSTFLVFRPKAEGVLMGEEGGDEQDQKKKRNRHGDDVLVSLGSDNSFGELGIGQHVSPSSFVNTVSFECLRESRGKESGAKGKKEGRIRILSISAGLRHVVALVSIGEVELFLVGWGSGRKGQVGQVPPEAPGGTTPRPGGRTPPIVWSPQIIQSWDLTPSENLEGGGRRPASSPSDLRCQVVAGREHSVFSLDGISSSRGSSMSLTRAIGSDKLSQSSVVNQTLAHLISEASSRELEVRQVACHWNGTMVLMQGQGDDHHHHYQELLSGGSNAKGQFGTGFFGPGPPTQPAEGGRNTKDTVIQAGKKATDEEEGAEAITPSAGSNFFRSELPFLNPSRGGERIEKLVCGSEHTLLLTSCLGSGGKSVWATGWNEHGNLALGDQQDRCRFEKIWPREEKEEVKQDPIGGRGRGGVVDVWAGNGTSFIQIESSTPSKRDVEKVRGRRKGIESEFTLALPKIELHAHLNGSIRRSTLSRLAMEAGIPEEEARILKEELKSLSKAFSFFGVIHKSVKTYDQITMIAQEVCEDFEADGVVYAEIRSTPRDLTSSSNPQGEGKESGRQGDQVDGKERYVQSVLKGFDSYLGSGDERSRREKCQVRLLLSIDRRLARQDPKVARDVVDLALKYRDKGVVGLDLSGDPTKGGWEDWEEQLFRARSQGLKITLHASEVPDSDAEMAKMLEFDPDRYGHCCYLSDDHFKKIRKGGKPLELCLTSNVLSNSVKDYANHHFGKHYRFAPKAQTGAVREFNLGSSALEEFASSRGESEGNPLILCTDDSAVFGSPLSQEYRIAIETFGLSQRDAFHLSEQAMTATFLNPGVSEADRTSMEIVRQKFQDFEKGWDWK